MSGGTAAANRVEVVVYCAQCEVEGAENDCWSCGKPMRLGGSGVSWSGSHHWGPRVTHCLFGAVPVACGDYIDDLL